VNVSFPIHAALTLFLCYLMGSILTGLIIGEAAYGIDIRKFGSGNVGFTNIKRVIGWKPAFLVLILDGLKGVAAVAIGRKVFQGHSPSLDQSLILLCGILAIVGHNWSCLAGFAGGKGVATSIGVLLALDARVALIALAIGLPLLAYPGYMSVASMVGSLSVPIGFWLLGDPLPFCLFGLVLSGFVIVRHRPNIQRLREGVEPKFSFRTRSEPPPGPVAKPETKTDLNSETSVNGC
jgi:acyl phosphate:glycerol-3-phosphate acyltransferase